MNCHTALRSKRVNFFYGQLFVKPVGCHIATPLHQDITFWPVAMGEMLPWALGQLRNRLGPMLERAGADSLLAELDPAAIEGTLDEVESLARSAQAELAAQRAQ